MTHHIHIFLLNSCNLKIKNLRINSVALCVSSCPQKQLNTAKDLQTFAERNGSYLCVYSLNSSEYTDNSKSANLCPPLPVSSSKSSPFFHHCVPQNPECYRQFVPVLVGTLNEVDFFHRMIAGIMASKESITGLSLLAAGAAFSTPEGFVNYKAFSSIRYMWWYHVLGLLWTSEFILACHQMTIAGAVVRVYFNRDKNNPPSHPVLSSIMNVFGYHLGTVVKGSLIVMLVRVPRIVLIYIHRALKGKVFVVCFTFFSGLMVFSYQQVLQVWVIPLLLISFLSYSVAHCFLSVFERVVDVLFLCYAIDLETNDGSTDKPYFMNKELMVRKNK
ncbi:CTL3 protein, partial [Polypterus senegalus]|nr:CTL3 protein [Polypterus senegalus]